RPRRTRRTNPGRDARSEEHTSELQSLTNLVCRLLLEKKKKKKRQRQRRNISVHRAMYSKNKTLGQESQPAEVHTALSRATSVASLHSSTLSYALNTES